jgi:hypothetical protein
MKRPNIKNEPPTEGERQETEKRTWTYIVALVSIVSESKKADMS